MKTRTLYGALPDRYGPNGIAFYFWADSSAELIECLKADDPIWGGPMSFWHVHSVTDKCGGLPRKGFVYRRAA